jgi:hypothetical protein
VTLQPDFCLERDPWGQGISAESALINQDLKIHSLKVEINPIQIASRKGILEGFKGNDAACEAPIILVSCAGRCSFIQGHPSSFCSRIAHSRTISQTTKTYVEFLGPKAAWTNLGKVLQFKEDFAISAFPKTVDHCFAFFVVFGQGPGTNRLDMPGTESWPTVSIENISTS